MKTSKGIIVGVVAVAVIGLVFYLGQRSNQVMTNGTPTPPAGEVNETPKPPTPVVVQASLPIAVTGAKAVPTDTTVVLTGSVTPNGALTNYWYEYGTSQTLGNRTPDQMIGSGYSAIRSPYYITGLTKDTSYYFRLNASNSLGRVSGTTYSFQTTHGISAPVGGVPTATTIAVSAVTNNTGTLNGEVSSNKVVTTYWFEYGKSANLGNTTALSTLPESGYKSPVSVSLSNLESNTTYYFRLNAQNEFGTVNGKTLNFKTDSQVAGMAPSVTTSNALSVKTTTGTLRGTVNPNKLETTYWFEYGTDSILSSLLLKTTSRSTLSAGANLSQVSRDISGLTTGTTYYFRVVAQNSLGVVRGDNLSFKTK